MVREVSELMVANDEPQVTINSKSYICSCRNSLGSSFVSLKIPEINKIR